MKISTTYNIAEGAKLILKADRQKAYGFAESEVVFVRIEPRKGYKTPWVIGTSLSGRGYFKPSDFV